MALLAGSFDLDDRVWGGEIIAADEMRKTVIQAIKARATLPDPSMTLSDDVRLGH